MPRKGITRRRVIAGSAAGMVSGFVPARLDALPRFMHGSPPPASLPLVAGMSRTFVNTSASPSPSDWAIEVIMEFVVGEVPAGYIAEPEVSGIVQNYNVAEATIQHWGDGSLHIAKYLITGTGAVGAGQPITFDFRKKLGSFDYTTAIDADDFVAETDFRLRLSNVHTARIAGVNGTLVAITINNATGQVSGGKAIYPTNLTRSTANVLYGGGVSGAGSGGQISFSGGVATVVNPGSGYSFAAASIETALNDIIAAVASGGNRANGVYWEWVARGRACDELKATVVRHAVLPHLHVGFYIKRWKKTDGSLLTYSFVMGPRIGVISSTPMNDYTYDMDAYELVSSPGSAIRGASTGDVNRQSIPNNVAAGCFSFDESGSDDWLANSAAHNAFKMVLTPDECRYFWGTHTLAPWSSLDSTGAVPSVESYWNQGIDTESGAHAIGRYRPMGSFGMRNGQQQDASTSNTFAPASTEACQRYWLACLHGRQSEALTFLNNVVVTAAHAASSGNMGGAKIIEPTTTYLPNIYPASQYSFPGMTPTRESGWMSAPTMNIIGTSHPMIVAGGVSNGLESVNNTSHMPNMTFAPYALLGREWMRDNAIFAGISPVFSLSFSKRIAIFGGRTYRGVRADPGNADFTSNVRIPAWYSLGIGLSARIMKEGSVERAHAEQVVYDNYSYLSDLPGYVGSLTHGEVVRTKSIDFSGKGTYPDQFFPGTTSLAVPYMEDYEANAYFMLNWLWRDTAIGAKIKRYRDYRSAYYVNRFAGPGNIYYSQAQRVRTRMGVSATTGVAVDFLKGLDVNAPEWAIFSTIAPAGQALALLVTTAGSDIVEFYYPLAGVYNPVPYIRIYGTTELNSGSRILPTTDNFLSTKNDGMVPGGLTEDFPYYFQRLSASTGRLCTDVGLTTPAIPTQSTRAPIDSITWSGGVVTVITASPHGFVGTKTLRIHAAVPAAYNANRICTITGANTFTFPLASNPGVTTAPGFYLAESYFWMVPNLSPPLSAGTHHSGTVTDGDSRVGFTLGVLRLGRALALPGDDTTNLDIAIFRIASVFSALGSSYGSAIYMNMSATPPP